MDARKEAMRQLELLRPRAAEIIPEGEFLSRVEASVSSGKPLRIKYGIDPTNPEIHIGHLVPVRVLRLLQDLGHTAVLIVGDYTARIGDPTGRNAERPPLSDEEVRANAARYAEQLFTVVDESRAELHFQSSWFGSMGLDEVLRMVSSFSVAQVLAHETFSSRMEAGRRLSLHEIVYPVLQAYDSFVINANVEIGGTDQRFNCLCGRDFQRDRGVPPQLVITVPLLMGTDGAKMSKSADNHIAMGLAANEIVGRVMSIPDELLPNYVTLCTSWSAEEQDTALRGLHSSTAHPRDTKLLVAQNIAAQLHGETAASEAVAEFERVFTRGGTPSEVPLLTVAAAAVTIVDIVMQAGFASSTSEVRRLVAQGGVRVNDRTVQDVHEVVNLEDSEEHLLHVGKRRFARLARA